MTATEWAMARRAEQLDAHDGDHLLAQARAACEQLPEGPLTLITTSPEGAALAGAICVVRDVPTRWRVVNLGRRMEIEGAVAVVEAVTLAPGLREALGERYPGAPIIDGVPAAVEMATA